MGTNAALARGAARAWRVRKSALGTIYAFGTADGAHVKIGFTTELQKRFRDLSRNAYYYGELTHLIGAVFGTFADERRIHAALHGQSLYSTQRRAGPRELYPVAVLNHPACRAIFGNRSPS